MKDSSDFTQQKLLPKMLNSSKAAINNASKQTFSHINIESSVLEVGHANRSSDSQQSSKVVKVPNLPSNELNVDYLTVGSTGPDNKETNKKQS